MTDLSLEVEAQDSPIQRFRKRPVEIQAMQWTGDNWEELIPFIGNAGTLGPLDEHNLSTVEITTLEGTMTASPGDWVIRGVKGEFYPCRADIFAATYDVAPEPLELTLEEQAAVAKSLHMSTCHDPDCSDCAKELRMIRRIVKAIRPHIEKPLKERIEEAEGEYRLLADQIGILASDGWDDDAAEVHILTLFVQHLATFHPDCPGRFCDDGPPVAAASIPTPIPDGEER